MRTIQEVGLEILNDNPSKIYIFLGNEYAIKMKYLDKLHAYYKNIQNLESYKDIHALTRKYQLIPTETSTLYIVRYDTEFVRTLNDSTKSDLERLNINGTLVFIYDSESDSKRLDKYLPDYTVSFFPISHGLQKKYIISDYPELSESTIDAVVALNLSYTESNTICNLLSAASIYDSVSYSDLKRTFSVRHSHDIAQLQILFADRDYCRIFLLLDQFDNLSTDIHYKLLQVLIELMKVRKLFYNQSKYSNYANKWTMSDLSNMFNIIYNEIVKLRTISSDVYGSIIFISILLGYKYIPKEI